MDQGWIKVHRKISEGIHYFQETFCRNMAWIDLLILANHSPNSYRCRGVRVEVNRGQIGYSLETLAKRWKWSRGKVIRFLNELENEHQIVQQKSNVITLISIVNYDLYQSNGQQTVQQTDNRKTANGQQTDNKRTQTRMYKNEENDNNEKNVKNDNTVFVDEKSSTDIRWNLWVESWFNFYTTKVGIKPSFTGAEPKALKTIRKYLSENCPGENSPDENGLTAWNQILDNWQCQDQWMITQLELKIISSKINIVLTNIKKHSDAKQFKSAPINNLSNTAKELDEYFAKRYPKQQPDAG